MIAYALAAIGAAVMATAVALAAGILLVWLELPRAPKHREVVRPRIQRRAPSQAWGVEAETLDEAMDELAGDGRLLLEMDKAKQRERADG